MQTSAHHRDLVTAYLLAQAGLPFSLCRDDAGQPHAAPLPTQPGSSGPARPPRTAN